MPEINLEERTICIPSGPFMLGSSMDCIENWVLKADQEKNLGIGNLLADTPPRWVYVNGFRIGKTMVTNGEYREFMNAKIGNEHFFDSKELWDHVWNGLNFKIERITSSVVNWEGEVIKTEENYGACANAVEAYIESLKYEINSLFPALKSETEKNFGYIKHRLSPYFKKENANPLGDLWLDLNTEDSAFDDYKTDVKKALQGVGQYTKKLYLSYGENIPSEHEDLFRKGEYPIECVIFLKRFYAELAQAGERRISLRSVLFPRFWDYLREPGSSNESKILQFDTKVPWSARILTGISLYEAAAYTVWLSQKTGKTVRLPDETEFEKAATWPVRDEQSEGALTAGDKHLFPWSEKHDFHTFFGQEGKELADYYYMNREEFNRLVETTSKDCGDQGALKMMAGFGWQWTRERYDQNERRYGRFELLNYPEHKAREYSSGDKPVRVFSYVPVDNLTFSHFVARGCPDIIGGPGIATRRFAFYPLRGYPDIGFRYCVETDS